MLKLKMGVVHICAPEDTHCSRDYHRSGFECFARCFCVCLRKHFVNTTVSQWDARHATWLCCFPLHSLYFTLLLFHIPLIFVPCCCNNRIPPLAIYIKGILSYGLMRSQAKEWKIDQKSRYAFIGQVTASPKQTHHWSPFQLYCYVKLGPKKTLKISMHLLWSNTRIGLYLVNMAYTCIV